VKCTLPNRYAGYLSITCFIVLRENAENTIYFLSPQHVSYLEALGNYEEENEKALSRHPIGYLGEPNDIAYGVLYLASDESRFMTGSELVIDGGYLAR